MSIETLSREFREVHWAKFVQFSKEEINSFPVEVLTCLDEENIPADIKTVIIYRLGANAETWIHKNVDAFSGNKPIDLLVTEEGIKALKEGLLRMPD
ncbi:hypothetical protein ACFQZE_18615 [Paenibacillus sp. GCM10027627]|uniref:hypothetical protein n=1 Tax=unclassified Paenibacillus TaxID=185978 RepID=UPI003629EBFA